MSGLFDFNDLSDLPAPLQAKLANGGRVNPNITIYADIVKAGSAAGVEVMSGRMIEAVACRMDLPSISDNAMRTALNGAVTAGLIRKISRQTYGVIEADVEVASMTPSEAPPIPAAVEQMVVEGTNTAPMPVDPLA